MMNKLIKKALENFQFTTINGRIKFNDVGKVVRIAKVNQGNMGYV